MQAIRWTAYLFLALASVVPLSATAEDKAPYQFRLADGSLAPAGDVFVPAKPSSRTALIPPYPPRLLRAGIEGHFEADLTVSENGRVTDVQITHSAGARLDEVALKHVRKVRFSPALLNGVPVASRYPAILDWETR